MDELEDVTLHVWSDINLIFSVGGDRPRSKFDDVTVNNLSACKCGLPESECTQTTFNPRDCCKVWDEAKRTNNTDRLIKFFEKCSQFLLHRFKDNNPTDKDKSVLVNFLCLNGVVKKQEVNMTSLDGEPLNDSLQVLECTELGTPCQIMTKPPHIDGSVQGPPHQTATEPPHIDGSVQGPPHQTATEPPHIDGSVQGPPHQTATEPPHIDGSVQGPIHLITTKPQQLDDVETGTPQLNSSIVQEIYENIKRTTQKPPENIDPSTTGPPENIAMSEIGTSQDRVSYMHGQPDGVINTVYKLPEQAICTVKRPPQEITSNRQGQPEGIASNMRGQLEEITSNTQGQPEGKSLPQQVARILKTSPKDTPQRAENNTGEIGALLRNVLDHNKHIGKKTTNSPEEVKKQIVFKIIYPKVDSKNDETKRIEMKNTAQRAVSHQANNETYNMCTDSVGQNPQMLSKSVSLDDKTLPRVTSKSEVNDSQLKKTNSSSAQTRELHDNEDNLPRLKSISSVKSLQEVDSSTKDTALLACQVTNPMKTQLEELLMSEDSIVTSNKTWKDSVISDKHGRKINNTVIYVKGNINPSEVYRNDKDSSRINSMSFKETHQQGAPSYSNNIVLSDKVLFRVDPSTEVQTKNIADLCSDVKRNIQRTEPCQSDDGTLGFHSTPVQSIQTTEVSLQECNIVNNVVTKNTTVRNTIDIDGSKMSDTDDKSVDSSLLLITRDTDFDNNSDISAAQMSVPNRINVECNKISCQVTTRRESCDDGDGKTKEHLPNKRVKLNPSVTDSSDCSFHGNQQDIIATASESVLPQITSTGEWKSSDGNIVVKEEIDSGAEDDGHDDDSVQNHFVVVGNMKSENGSYDNTMTVNSASDKKTTYSSSDKTTTYSSSDTTRTAYSANDNTTTMYSASDNTATEYSSSVNTRTAYSSSDNTTMHSASDNTTTLSSSNNMSAHSSSDVTMTNKSNTTKNNTATNGIVYVKQIKNSKTQENLQHVMFLYPNQVPEDHEEVLCLCPECGKVFWDKNDLIEHLKCHEMLECNLCNKIFGGELQLRKHQQIHQDIRPFECTKCKKSFRQKGSLDSHSRIHTGEKPFQCKFCDESFCHRRSCDIHERHHTGHFPFPCGYCKKGFHQRSTLADHMTTHTGEKPYLCDVCGRDFAIKRTFEIHMVTHTGEKNVCCEVCRKRFSCKKYLRVHMRVHTGETPYQCDICGKLFKQKSNLTSHQKVHKKKK
ncbi:uncharacterized protein LOC144450149 [Glandiceps talaboti]